MDDNQFMAQERRKISDNMRHMNEQQFGEFMRRMGEERERIGNNISRKIVAELPIKGEANTVYYILQDGYPFCTDPECYNIYHMWHCYPEGGWCDWGRIEVPKNDEDFYLGCKHAEESLDDVISDFF